MSQKSIFEQAATVFPVTVDPDTGLRLLYAAPLNQRDLPSVGYAGSWSTPYHQQRCFSVDGKSVYLNYSGKDQTGKPVGAQGILDLTTGMVRRALPEGYYLLEFAPRGNNILTLKSVKPSGYIMCIWDSVTGRDVASFDLPGWKLWSGYLLACGTRVVLGHYKGAYYNERVDSVFHLLSSDGSAEEIFKAEGFFCNHIQSCPTDPDLYSYNKWPSPMRKCDVVLHFRDVRGSFDVELPQNPCTVRPGSIWGGQRDHYLWTPDGSRIASYFSPIDSDSKNHFDYGWWLSVMNWRTGEDLATAYPTDRWAGHFGVSPDSRYLFAVGRESFPKVFAIDIEKLREGWNEQVLCNCPPSFVRPDNHGPFHMPFCLPDQSGVIFTAGWTSEKRGVFIVELPDDLRKKTK